MRFIERHLRLALLVSLLSLPIGCGSDDSAGGGPNCGPGERFNEIRGECEPTRSQTLDAGRDDSGTLTEDTGGRRDSGPLDTSPPPDASPRPDVGADASPTPDIGPDAPATCPDRDGDGFADAACGGRDCDDTVRAISPGAPETCDELDNNCNGTINDGIECAFYAHSSQTMYLVDPFAKTAQQVTSVPGLFDMDTHPDGTLYGITGTALFEFDATSNTWTEIGPLGVTGTPNGLAIDNRGTAYMTASNTVYTVDLTTGAGQTIGSMGGNYNSSGDCVVNKDNSLYMSSNGGFSLTDSLVVIDGTTGRARSIGSIGSRAVYGLTAAWGRMYGLTETGALIEIDVGTGQGTPIHTFNGISWYGAASTPQR